MQRRKRRIKEILLAILGFFLLLTSIGIIWLASINLPDVGTFEERKIIRSTKIYDRTGEIVLYDVNENVRRSVISPSEMGAYIKNATVAIEDDGFYQHQGIELKAFIRAMIVNITSGSFSQGGSTITQQVVKNTLLTQEKRIQRKLKEWVLALKLENRLSKDEILGVYLNENPYGGKVYGIAEASRNFFGKEPVDLTLAEAAYLAAIPNAPTYYSPYGSHIDELEMRKNVVLKRMLELSFITEDEYRTARNEEVEFLPQQKEGIQAPHFVFYILEQLERRYGRDVVESGGLQVYTTLDYELQKKAEEIVLKHALQNEADWNASNAGLVALDPKTGEILVMVGSRGYFDEEIDGKYNVTIAKRQPGSSFKPFAYTTAFQKGYTLDTVVFDIRTQFTDACGTFAFTSDGDCYSPQNYDGLFKGPISFRDALAQSRNIASVKVLYLAGVQDSLAVAKTMGITTLGNADQYGLTLVLGGGEVRLLDMTSAYGVFATDGIRYEPTSIKRIEDEQGNIRYEHRSIGKTVLNQNVARTINDVLSDNEARTPLVGSRSFMYFEGYDVAGKTGTTNNNRDAWMIGYTPEIAVGVWSGNNDNTPMKRGSAISGRLWGEFMSVALPTVPSTPFAEPVQSNVEKPIIRGVWLGGEVVEIDKISGKLATEYTPPETIEELIVTNVHSILHWVDRKDPLGPAPENPDNDNQYDNWEPVVRSWWNKNSHLYPHVTENDIPKTEDSIHIPENVPEIEIVQPQDGIVVSSDDQLLVEVVIDAVFPIQKVDIFVNGSYIGTAKNEPFSYLFSLTDVPSVQVDNQIEVVVYDSVFNKASTTTTFHLSDIN